AEELAQHLEDRCRELLSGGATEEDAFRKAISELDDTYPLRAELALNHNAVPPPGDASRGNFADGLWLDLRYAVRTLRKSPVFAMFVVLTLALGMGANTTVFTVINTFILNPL